MEEYEIEKILARGTFGTVYLVHSKKDARKRPLVIKQLSMEVFDNSDRMSTLNETELAFQPAFSVRMLKKGPLQK